MGEYRRARDAARLPQGKVCYLTLLLTEAGLIPSDHQIEQMYSLSAERLEAMIAIASHAVTRAGGAPVGSWVMPLADAYQAYQADAPV